MWSPYSNSLPLQTLLTGEPCDNGNSTPASRAHLVESVKTEHQSVAIVVDVRKGHLVLAVAEHSQLPIPCRLQEAWEEKIVPEKCQRRQEAHTASTPATSVVLIGKTVCNHRHTPARIEDPL